MLATLRYNWTIYLMEAICLGLFMMSASLFATLLEFPGSPVHHLLPNDFLRLCLMGLAMGITNILLIYSPMGKLSGAHMNPAVTLTFFGLGKVKKWDAFYYILFQCIGGIVAVMLMDLILGRPFETAPVNYVVTMPGKQGATFAFWTEVTIAFGMMMMVLVTSNHKAWSKYTGYIAGFFVMGYIILTAPVSGFSMNPARTLASAIPAHNYTSLWIYLTAPFLGMFSGAVIFKRFYGQVVCAKFFHTRHFRCIFNCGYNKH